MALLYKLLFQLKLLLLLNLCCNCCKAYNFSVRNFGAKGNGVTDDTKAIQRAIDFAKGKKGTVFFPKGIYLVSNITVTANYLENYFLRIYSNIIFLGEGESTVIKVANHILDKVDSNANAHVFYGVNIENVSFLKILIEMNGKYNLVPPKVIKNGCAIFIDNGKNINIRKTTIQNCAGRNMVIIKGKGNTVLIDSNNFTNGGNYIGNTIENKNQTDFSFVYCEWDSTVVTNNIITQKNIEIALNWYTGGVEIHGSYCYAAYNKITGCNPGFYISSSWHQMQNTIIEKNSLLNCIRGISFWVNFSMNYITINENKITLTKSRRLKPYCLVGIEVPNGNATLYDFTHANAATISNLRITKNTISTNSKDSINDRTVGMILHSVQNSIIENNFISKMNFGGIIIQGSKWGSCNTNISNNIFSDFKPNVDLNIPSALILINDEVDYIKYAFKSLDSIFIKSNSYRGQYSLVNKMNTIGGKHYEMYVTGSKALKKGIHFYNNFSKINNDSIPFFYYDKAQKY